MNRKDFLLALFTASICGSGFSAIRASLLGVTYGEVTVSAGTLSIVGDRVSVIKVNCIKRRRISR